MQFYQHEKHVPLNAGKKFMPSKEQITACEVTLKDAEWKVFNIIILFNMIQTA